MAQHDTHHHTYIERDRVPVESGTSSAALAIIGGLVVAVGILFWLFTGGTETTAPAGDGNVSVTVEGGAPASGGDNDGNPAPAGTDAAPLPFTETAPADGGATGAETAPSGD